MGSDLTQHGTLCTARRKNGTPCKNWAIRGSNVCRMHGGSAPQVKRAAMVRLLMAADTLMAELLLIALDKNQPAPLRLAAIRDALDRAGLSGKTEVEVDLRVSNWQAAVEAVTFEEIIIDAEEADEGDTEPGELVLSPEPEDEYVEAIESARRKNVRRGKSPTLTDAQRREVAKSVGRSRRSLEDTDPPTPPPTMPQHPAPPLAKRIPQESTPVERLILSREDDSRRRKRKRRR